MDSEAREHVTAILLGTDGADNDGDRLGRLVPLVYDELRAMASRRLRNEMGVVTLSATELVHESYLRLADTTRVTARGRAYFFAAAAKAMRRVIIDHARRRRRLRRGGNLPVLTLDENIALVEGAPVDMLDLDRGLDRLADVAARPARVLECRFFGGLTVEETALALDVTPRTVNRDWEFARAWLFDFLSLPPSSS